MHDELVADDRWMQRCDALAARAGLAGEAAVGCVIIRDGVVVSEAWEGVIRLLDHSAHAEVLALRGAAKATRSLNLRGCVLYSNREPCIMCAFAIREAEISEVVVREPISSIGGITSHYSLLTDTSIADWCKPPRIRWYGQASLSGVVE